MIRLFFISADPNAFQAYLDRFRIGIGVAAKAYPNADKNDGDRQNCNRISCSFMHHKKFPYPVFDKRMIPANYLLFIYVRFRFYPERRRNNRAVSAIFNFDTAAVRFTQDFADVQSQAKMVRPVRIL